MHFDLETIFNADFFEGQLCVGIAIRVVIIRVLGRNGDRQKSGASESSHYFNIYYKNFWEILETSSIFCLKFRLLFISLY